MDKDEIFIIKARRCKRCGRLLTSEKAVRDGYGESCRCKAKKEERENEPLPGQISMFDFQNQMGKKN